MKRSVLGRGLLATALLCSTFVTVHLTAQTSGAPTHPWRDSTGGMDWASSRIAADPDGNVYSSAEVLGSSTRYSFSQRMLFQKRDRDNNVLYSVQYGGSVAEYA